MTSSPPSLALRRDLAPPAHDVALGAVRSLVTLLVVAHHAVLAYHPFAPPPPRDLLTQGWWLAFPVVDTARWSGAQLLVTFNDTFFMSLLFLVSGAFVWPSLARKGPARFLRDRARRLGVPFLLAAFLLAPLAYLPSYLQSGGAFDLAAFARVWTQLGTWPTGPAWFLSLLLAFDLLAAAAFAAVRSPTGAAWLAVTRRHPLLAFLALAATSAAVYLPLASRISPLAWTTWGPFTLQTTRLGHYAVYFAAGVLLGCAGLARGLLAAGGNLARRWLPWLAATAVATWFVAMSGMRAFTAVMTRAPDAETWQRLAALGFVAACAATSFAALAVALRFVRRDNAILASLARNAFAIYIVHYAIVSWLQYALLDAPLPGVAKAGLVTTSAIALSWLVAAAVRRLRGKLTDARRGRASLEAPSP